MRLMRFLFQITFYSNYFLAPETGSFFISYMMKSDEKSDFKSSQNEYPLVQGISQGDEWLHFYIVKKNK